MDTGIYLRKSRAEELTDTTQETLKRHKETLLIFAQQQQLNIIDTYEEVISGENLYTRCEMLRLLSDVELGKLEAVLCMDIDRLGRGSMSQQGIILETLKEANVKIITPRKTYDLNNDLDEEYTEFQTFFARRELKTIKRRLRQGINKSLLDGGYISNAPYGYENCRVEKLPSLKIIKDEAVFVEMIFDMYVNQGFGCKTIADKLNILGAIPKRGAKFSRTTVKTIIQNPVYIGKIVFNKRHHHKPDNKNNKYWSTLNPESEWIVSNGQHPAIINNDIYNKAQDILSNRYHPPYFSGKLTNPLAGIVTCAKCGKKMVKRSFNHGNIVYLMCPSKGCVKMTSFYDIEKIILSTVKEQMISLKINTIKYSNNGNDNIIEKSIAYTKKEIDILNCQKEKLHDLLEQEVYTPEVFLERKSSIEDKIKKLNSGIKSMQQKLDKKNRKNVSLSDIKNVFDVYNLATTDDKNRLLKMMIKNVFYYKHKQWPSEKFVLIIVLKHF